MSPAIKLYYKLTASIPRHLPKTKEDVEKVKEIFTLAYNLKDSPQVWYTIFANMAAMKADETKISYKRLTNIAKRLDINKLLQDQKLVEHQKHMDTLTKEADDYGQEQVSKESGADQVPGRASDL